MSRIFNSVAVLLVLMSGVCLAAPPAAPAGGPEKVDLDTMINERTGVLETEIQEAGPGDNKQFTIKADSNIASLEVGDLYRSAEGAFFKVIGIRSKGAEGGTFVIQRTAGSSEPGKKFNRVAGVGPMTIVARTTLLDLYIMGGPFLHPIALLFVAMIMLTINSLMLYRRRRQIPEDFVEQAEHALDRGDIAGFEGASLREKGLFAHVCRAMVERMDTSSMEDIKLRCEVAAGKQIGRLKAPVKFMNLIAVAAPLLGLLGTIVGMVIVFEAVAGSTGASKAAALASGIRVKLFSTAAALCVAIPALFLYFIFNQKLTALISDCEVITERFLHKIAVLKRSPKPGPQVENKG